MLSTYFGYVGAAWEPFALARGIPHCRLSGHSKRFSVCFWDCFVGIMVVTKSTPPEGGIFMKNEQKKIKFLAVFCRCSPVPRSGAIGWITAPMA